MNFAAKTRLLAICGAAAVAVGATGCTMCAHPYDYCGPTFTGGHYTAGPEGRAGSILAGQVMSGPVAMSSAPDQVAPPSPQPHVAPPAKSPDDGYAPGQSPDITSGIPQEHVISVTDRRIDEASPEVVQDSSSPAPRPVPSDRTAKRPRSRIR